MNKRSIKRGLLQGAAVLVLGSQSLVHAQSSEPSAPAAPAPATEAPAAAPAADTPAAAPATAPLASGAKVIFVNTLMRYSVGANIDNAVLNECQLPQQGLELLDAAVKEAGLSLVRDDAAVKAAKGRTFEVEIVSVVSAGNAFTGHRKQVSVRGRLLEGGKELGIFNGTRSSMGGAFAGFKGSCSVLGRCLEALSKDMAVWLKQSR
jgi:hypothetical protein